MDAALDRLLNDPARAWAPFEPSKSAPWDLPRAAHLHRRAGFAAPWRILRRDVADGPEAAVDRLIRGEATSGDGQAAADFDRLADAMASSVGDSTEPNRPQAAWLYRITLTSHPLLERMTMFWHDHFATSIVKVQNPAMMRRQIELLRTHALGDFKTMLAKIGKDPAMLVWLDSTVNRKAKPNENYAREVMELFALGRGRYSEKDIQEAARAFTGWFVIRDKFSELRAQHDDGEKSVLGKRGRFTGDDIPPILLEQPACAEFLCGKLFRHFVSDVDEPTSALIAPLARAFRESSYDIKVPVRMILRSNLLNDASVRRRRVKSPVEYAAGTIRSLEIVKPTVSAIALAEACAQMGQTLYAPPSVAGWEGGPSWINTTAMLARTNLALSLLGKDEERLGGRFDPDAAFKASGHSGDFRAFYRDLLTQDAIDLKTIGATKTAKDAAIAILTSPEYQLA